MALLGAVSSGNDGDDRSRELLSNDRPGIKVAVAASIAELVNVYVPFGVAGKRISTPSVVQAAEAQLVAGFTSRERR
jgi:hypothetical protein